MTTRESQAKYAVKNKNDNRMTVKSLNGLSTHLIMSIALSMLPFGASSFGKGLGVRRLTGATLAGTFFAVTMIYTVRFHM
jgi:hypothetical protein